MLKYNTSVVKVKKLWTNDYKRQDGTMTTYYNVKVVDTEECENQTFSCNEEVYKQLEENEEYILYGKIGSNDKGKWWSVTDAEHIVYDDEPKKK